MLRVALDTPPGSRRGVTLETLALASRLMSRGSTTTTRSPGGTPWRSRARASSGRSHAGPFPPRVGKVVAIRLSDVGHDERRVTGTLVGADDTTATLRVDGPDGPVERAIPYSQIDRARTVFEWGPATKKSGSSAAGEVAAAQAREGEGDSVTNLDMSEAIRLLAQEKGLSEDSLLHVLVDALASAYKRRPGAADEVVVEVDPQTMEFTFTAYDLDEDGNWVNERDDTPKRDELGRIVAQTFRQVMSQRIREVERDRKFEEYANREGDIVTGIIQQTDTRYTLLDLGRVEALLPQAEQVPFERPQPGDRCKAYIVEVRRTAKGPQIVVSRTHPGLIKRLFELEVPEIADGIVEIKACAASQATAPSSPYGPTTTTSTRSAPVSGRGAAGRGWSSTSSAARRSTSSRSATTSPTSWPRRFRPPRSRRC